MNSTHLPEGAQTCQDASTDPSAVLALWRSKDLDAHLLDRQSLYLVQQTVTKSFGKGRASRQNDVAV